MKSEVHKTQPHIKQRHGCRPPAGRGCYLGSADPRGRCRGAPPARAPLRPRSCHTKQPMLRPVRPRGRRLPRPKPRSPAAAGTAGFPRSVHRGPAVAMGPRPPLPLATARGTEAHGHWPGPRARRPLIGRAAAHAQWSTRAPFGPSRREPPAASAGSGERPRRELFP